MTGVPRVAIAVEPPPAGAVLSRLEAVQVVVATCQDELERWGSRALREQVAAEVVLDQAGLLRHQLRGAASDAAQLRVQVRDLERHPGVVWIAASPVTLAVAAAATSLHAAAHALGPVSGACRGEQSVVAVGTSLGASRRFLRIACSALLDAARLLRVTQQVAGGPVVAGDCRPHLRLVSDIGASIEGDPR